MKTIGQLVALSLALALATPAFAQTAEDAGSQALALAEEGDVLSGAGDIRSASERYRRAFELLPLPSFALRAAQTLERLGELVEAQSLYLAAALAALPSSAPPEQVSARATAELDRQKLLPRIPTVLVLLVGASADEVNVSVNDEAVPSTELGRPRLVNPGRVRVRGVRGETSVEISVEVREGEVKPVRLAFGADAPEPRNPGAAPRLAARPGTGESHEDAGGVQRLVGYVAMGVGGAALLTGGAFTLLALKDESDLEARCPAATCPPSLESEVDTYESKKTIAAIGLGTGAALAVAGIALVLTASDERVTSAALGVSLDASGARLWGAF